ncbi:helix-turn-helix transcriptional regulator [Streptantibioticus rubrisoli]|uniref:Helix-turn-helix transcriptional regulator n=1 Tax=Streptantibioticus rubrisoli TaxID=1387313 RepID=A0ABT1PDU2_9ACTN|nr:helix-turn-helix transcriptional regulator [Streptantibioticus rubrisoli]MCQ4043534.1 helix-turn-helix transcriptional regulator [Streptantibioticus rubrisoli]
MGAINGRGTTAHGNRRTELAAYLRSRRARVTPQDVGLPPGPRRRTPGLRREEVAQLAGVGVTWYTWLEQGRPINASVQVLDAVARVLRLDATEREHLYRLAGVPFVREAVADADEVDPEVQAILDALDPLAAVVYNARYDVRAANTAYCAIWPATRLPDLSERNVLWRMFTVPPCCQNLRHSPEEAARMVAQLRSAYGRHLGEPAWEHFIDRLIRASADFAQLWASGDVAPPGRRTKIVDYPGVGELRLVSTSLAIDGMPEHRIVVYTPENEATRARLAQLRALGDPVIGCPLHGRPLSELREERERAAQRA